MFFSGLIGVPLAFLFTRFGLLRPKSAGTAVLLSTHHLDEVVAYCTRVAILEEGALIDEVNLFDRRERFRLRVTDTSAGLHALEAQPEVVTHATIRGSELVFIPRSQEDLGEASRILAAAGVGVLEMNRDIFDLRPAAINRDLDLRRPIYKRTAAYGHFGRSDGEGFPWESTDRVDALRSALGT